MRAMYVRAVLARGAVLSHLSHAHILARANRLLVN